MKRKTIKKIIKKVDKRLGSHFLHQLKRIEKFWNNLVFLNVFYSKIGIVRLKCKMGFVKEKRIKLHLGCGNIKKEGYINIDVVKTPATDLIWDITQKLPFQDNSVERIESYHTLEHLPVCLMANINPSYGKKYESIVRLLKEWNRVLKSGGRLIIEVPDFDTLLQEYIKADNGRKEELLTCIYGGFRNKNIYDIHRWGINRYRLTYILREAGFQKFEFQGTKDYHTKFCPCLRVDCIKD